MRNLIIGFVPMSLAESTWGDMFMADFKKVTLADLLASIAAKEAVE